MRTVLFVLAVLGFVVVLGGSANAAVVTLTFDPNDLMLYPSSAGDENVAGESKATQADARRYHQEWASEYYETFYNPSSPHSQPSDYDAYVTWVNSLGEGEGIACFNSWFLNNPAAGSWGETVVSKPGSTFSATAGSGWQVAYVVDPYSLGGTSAQWYTLAALSEKRLCHTANLINC